LQHWQDIVLQFLRTRRLQRLKRPFSLVAARCLLGILVLAKSQRRTIDADVDVFRKSPNHLPHFREGRSSFEDHRVPEPLFGEQLCQCPTDPEVFLDDDGANARLLGRSFE
jgi:hypothetical protein